MPLALRVLLNSAIELCSEYHIKRTRFVIRMTKRRDTLIGVETESFRQGLHSLNFYLCAISLWQCMSLVSAMSTQCHGGGERLTTQAAVCTWAKVMARLTTFVLGQSPTLFLERTVLIIVDYKVAIEAPERELQTGTRCILGNESVWHIIAVAQRFHPLRIAAQIRLHPEWNARNGCRIHAKGG
jgi:hypothetical protein